MPELDAFEIRVTRVIQALADGADTSVDPVGVAWLAAGPDRAPRLAALRAIPAVAWTVVVLALLLALAAGSLLVGSWRAGPFWSGWAPPVPVVDIEGEAAEFDRAADGFVTAWSSGEPSTMRDIFTGDIRIRSGTMSWEGMDEAVALADDMLSSYPEYSGTRIETYVGIDGGILASDWALTPTEPIPNRELEVFTTSGRLIETWALFEHPTLKHDPRDPVLDSALLESYASAWSSGDPTAVRALYALEATREDSLFGDRAEGPAAIEAAAGRFFDRSSAIAWELEEGFGEPQAGDMAGLFTVHVTTSGGTTCDIGVAVILTQGGVGIDAEHLYYEPDSLAACGWAG